MQDLINDLLRRAAACKRLAENYAGHADAVDRSRCLGKAEAYKRAAELVLEEWKLTQP